MIINIQFVTEIPEFFLKDSLWEKYIPFLHFWMYQKRKDLFLGIKESFPGKIQFYHATKNDTLEYIFFFKKDRFRKVMHRYSYKISTSCIKKNCTFLYFKEGFYDDSLIHDL